MKPFDVYPLFPIEPVSASGAWITDKKGNKYLDFYGGHGVISIGHSHPHYVQKLQYQLGKIGFYSNSVQIPLQDELAGKLGEISGYPGHQLFLCNSGAEANENALKLASFVTGKKKIIALKGAFHGRTSLAVECTDDLKIQAPVNRNENVVFVPMNDTQALEAAFSDDVAAFIFEGIQGVSGVHEPQEHFLKAAETLCKKHHALLIADEVQSGYGRTGKFFAHQYSGVKPHLISMAKGMGNGFPVAGVLIDPMIKPVMGMLGSTFGGNHLACAAAIAVLDVISSRDLISHAARVGNVLLEELKGMDEFLEVRGKGLMIALELKEKHSGMRNQLLEQHRIFTGASGKNIIRLLPPLNITAEEIEVFLNATKQIVSHQLISA